MANEENIAAQAPQALYNRKFFRAGLWHVTPDTPREWPCLAYNEVLILYNYQYVNGRWEIRVEDTVSSLCSVANEAFTQLNLPLRWYADKTIETPWGLKRQVYALAKLLTPS